jgi:hypothetical protein
LVWQKSLKPPELLVPSPVEPVLFVPPDVPPLVPDVPDAPVPLPALVPPEAEEVLGAELPDDELDDELVDDDELLVPLELELGVVVDADVLVDVSSS